MKHVFSAFRRYFGRSSESGQSVVLLALGFIALAGFVGITTDISLMFVRYAQLSRAVDSAAIAAANQMRQDRSNASVQLAARQFIEFYGLSPESVIVDTCLTTNFEDEDLCTEEQSKLVRVRAYFRQPTVFLRLLGVQWFDMWVSATSQTAALDVVIVMDVSESMAAQTTIQDWAKVQKLANVSGGTPSAARNLGVVYRPPRADEVYGRKVPVFDGVTYERFWKSWVWDKAPFDPLPGLLNTPQVKINNYLTYYPKGSALGYDVAGKADNAAGFSGIKEFRVDYANDYFVDARFPGQGFGTVSEQPRPECRVRLYPRAWLSDIQRNFQGEKNPDGTFKSYSAVVTAAGLPPITNFDGFLPTYNYYGCCNDPDGVDGFDDMVCQPFQQVRGATFGFLDRIDFLRGDRAAFVTYDRTAFLVNPFLYNSAAPGDETKRPGAMLDNKDAAYLTLKNLIGVRAEPYFYVMTPASTDVAPTPTTITRWKQASMGFDVNGNPRSVDYGSQTYNPLDAKEEETINYPVFDNCFVQNALLGNPRTLFAGGLFNASLPTDLVQNRPNGFDPAGYDLRWKDFNNTVPGSTGEVLMTSAIPAGTPPQKPVRTSYQQDASYEYWAACRSGNIGAALREANNALLNPNTSRRFGTIWIVVLMSDGGVGASDPVRRNGRKLNEFQPYQAISPNVFGVPGEYGAFGLCPIGTPIADPRAWGELINYANDTKGTQQASQPYCADESPSSRHTCDFRPLLALPNHPSRSNYVSAGISPLQDIDYKKAGASGGPAAGSTDAQVVAWNKQRNNLYDVDIAETQQTFIVNGISLPRGGCDPLYDVEDYARDWADYIAIANLGTTSSNTQVPTIFTIGFAIGFLNDIDPNNNTPLVSDINKPVNDPVNAVSAQNNVARLCEININRCLGEQLLRYIADIGDNNRIDNDYYQDLMYEWYQFKPGFNTPGSDLQSQLDGYHGRDGTASLTFGSRDACQTQDVGPTNNTYDANNNKVLDADEFVMEWGQLRANASCGNYYYSPSPEQLQFVFDDIASRMFTRLSR